MARVYPTRCELAGAGVLLLLAMAPGRSALHAQTAIEGTVQTAPRRTSRPVVTYSDGLLTVSANNSSLNQILREVARQTGMTISGGVAEDRVFGNYGPGAPAEILATLLDGTGCNMLIVQNSADAPKQLLLTPRAGGVTPPNPNAQGFEDSDSPAQAVSQPAPPPPPPAGPPANSRDPNRVGTGGIDTNPAATAPSSTSQQLVFPPVDSTTPPATATTTPTTPDPSADTVKTPQQIFEQLQKLRQQQQAPATPAPR